MADEKQLFTGVNHPKDMNNLTDLEKKHVPIITAPEVVKANEPFAVTVEVGKLLAHPNETGHFINFIDLYAGDMFLARLDLVPEHSDPKAVMSIQLDRNLGPLRAFEFCNLHGTWENTKPITVQEQP